jgi:Uma2 family endonuclease
MANAIGSLMELKQTAKKPRPIPFDAFYKKYATRVDGFKYEWNDGFIEKSEAMRQEELYIVENLTDFFYSIKPIVGGILTTEIETWTSNVKWRKPDMAYFSKDQIAMAAEKINTIPVFLLEFISKNDDINDVLDKNLEYFRAGVQVVWWVFPRQKQVHIYTSSRDVTICEQDMLCSAEMAVPYFSLTVDAIFKR